MILRNLAPYFLVGLAYGLQAFNGARLRGGEKPPILFLSTILCFVAAVMLSDNWEPGWRIGLVLVTAMTDLCLPMLVSPANHANKSRESKRSKSPK